MTHDATQHHDATLRQVREGYANIARHGTWNAARDAAGNGSCCSPGGGCCGPSAGWTPEGLARAIGYANDELDLIPQDANLGLSCGNPMAIASLKPGNIVLDLGSGAGFDCFLAGPKVGALGRVIGVDMTPEMVSKARAGIAEYSRRVGLKNVEFRLGEIENLPVADASVDVVISNCVLNLSPDKARVWKEVSRVLRPGGRVAVSDIALLRPLPEAARADVEALVGCIAGASLITEMRDHMQSAGLDGIRLSPKSEYVEVMVQAGDPLYQRILASLPAGSRVSDYVTSVDISATKPASRM